MKIKHEHIRMAMNAWARPDGEKVPAAGITQAYFEIYEEQGAYTITFSRKITGLLLYILKS